MADTTTKPREDVISLLLQQHKEIRSYFDRVEKAHGDDRRDLFHELVAFLAVHETAEEEIVHPEARRADGGEPVVKARLGEEHSAKETLSNLYDMGPEAEGFDTLFRQLKEDVLAHAEHEEREEFPLLRKKYDADRLHAMATWVRAAEAVAPTRPHPGVESAAANFVLGPPVAIMDRARDAIREILMRA